MNNMRTHRIKRKTVLFAIGILVLLSPLLWIGTAYLREASKYWRIKHYYRSDQDSFQEIASYFKDLYEDQMRNAKLELRDGKLYWNYRENPDTYEKDIANESIFAVLSGLRERYAPKSPHQYPVFSYADAYYDAEGNMLMILNAYSKPATYGDEPGYKSYYLIYIDKEYDGHASWLGIDTFGVTREPFSGNWCTWSKATPAG